jgi:uncharacterized membrane protein
VSGDGIWIQSTRDPDREHMCEITQLAVSFIDASGCARLNPHDLADVRKALADAVKWRITVLEGCRACRRDGLCARHAASLEAIEVYRSLAARLAPKD